MRLRIPFQNQRPNVEHLYIFLAMTDQHPSHARTSRSPDREHRQGRLTREPRSRSPHRHRRRSDDRRTRRHHHHDERADKSRQLANATLPMNARPLSKNDLSRYKPMFALYLDIQKQKYIEDLDEQEVRGRWKSFVGKWYVDHKASNLPLTYSACNKANILEESGRAS